MNDRYTRIPLTKNINQSQTVKKKYPIFRLLSNYLYGTCTALAPPAQFSSKDKVGVKHLQG